MTVPVVSVAAVSYLNTIPFLYGLRHSEELRADVVLSPPSGCVSAFADGRADVALVPVGGLGDISDYDIVSDWCIGASGPVRTVVLVSNEPLSQIKRVWLDGHSRTSVDLARVLAAKHWGIRPEWGEGLERLAAPQKGDAFVLIGDKVFENEGRFQFTWDLAAEWERFAKLPFTFAVWVARKGTPQETIDALQAALTLGVERVYEAIMESEYADREYAYEYLTRNIDYFFDEPKRLAMERFRALTSKPTAR